MGAVNSATGLGARGLPGQDGTSSGPVADFWRSNAGAMLPDGGSDTTEAISRTGLVGIGNVPGNTPLAQLDVARGGRSGTDPRTAATVGYLTGALPSLSSAASNPATPAAGVEFRHSNQTQGVGIAYDGVYATGSNANQDFSLMQRGTGQFFLRHQALLGGLNYLNHIGAAADTAGQGWYQRWFANGVEVAGELLRRSDQ
ncbi:MAG: hypothetical protein H5T76_23395, partial [Streptomyces sp.]|nr:hypothetical protein [Streptomyces sp.]